MIKAMVAIVLAACCLLLAACDSEEYNERAEANTLGILWDEDNTGWDRMDIYINSKNGLCKEAMDRLLQDRGKTVGPISGFIAALMTWQTFDCDRFLPTR